MGNERRTLLKPEHERIARLLRQHLQGPRALTTCAKIFLSSPGNVRSRNDAPCSSMPSAASAGPAIAFSSAPISARFCSSSSIGRRPAMARSASCSSV
jgi:hypothetical protein